MTINNVAYSWAMIELTAPLLTGSTGTNPTVLQGVSGIKWNIKHKIETNYGLGGEPANRGFGNTEYTASITMDYNTQTQLRGIAGSLMNIGEFDLTVSFANSLGSSDWTTEVVTLKGCIFNEDGMEAKQDDTSITHDFELNPFKIELQVTTA
ncbi:MAG: hypothetical protein LBM08_00915 [Dysgonamonadaceae bacterium]|jgi:hypothetical protein|nr:hypothetical protein [Dysgonamonadaceae bacterium]